MDCSVPSEILSPVVQAMLLAAAMAQKKDNALNLGLGCGAIERYASRAYPHLSLTTVELERSVFELAKECFDIPTSTSVELADARVFLQQNSGHFDLIFCDLAAANHQPAWLLSRDFLSALSRALQTGGVLSMNLICASTEVLGSAALRLREAFAWSAVYPVPGYDNVVLYAAHRAPSLPVSAHAASVNQAASADSDALRRITILP